MRTDRGALLRQFGGFPFHAWPTCSFGFIQILNNRLGEKTKRGEQRSSIYRRGRKRGSCLVTPQGSVSLLSEM